MLPVLSHRHQDLGAEQFACFQAIDTDVRALCEHQGRCERITDLLFAAFADSGAGRWRAVVQAIDQLIDDAAPSAPKDARFRLRQFVAENADLLVA